MSYSGRREPWRNEVVDLPVAQGLPGCIAEIFARLVDRALRAGVLQGYRTIEAPEPTVRGRVRFHDQVRRRFGRSLPAEITYDEFTLDIAENRILRAANQRMIKVPGLPDTTKRRLLLQSRRLETIADLVAGRPLPVWTPNRLNARY